MKLALTEAEQLDLKTNIMAADRERAACLRGRDLAGALFWETKADEWREALYR